MIAPVRICDAEGDDDLVEKWRLGKREAQGSKISGDVEREGVTAGAERSVLQ